MNNTISSVPVDYQKEREFYRWNSQQPQFVYRGFEVYYSAPNGGITCIDCLNPEGSYAIANAPNSPPFWELDDDELEEVAKSFIDGILSEKSLPLLFEA